LENEVQSCDVLIALIGEQWLNVKDEHGIRRLDNPNDFVRIEIATALKRDIRVIPVLLSGTQMPNVSDLPKNLQSLTRRNGLRVYHHSFHADTNRLIKHLEAALGAAEKDAQAKSEKEAAEKARLQAEEEAEREAAEKAAKKARLEAEELARQKSAKEKAEREATEKAARKKAEKEESEKARLEAEELARQEVAQKSIREKLLSVIVKKIAREKAEDVTQKALVRIEELLANAKATREKYEREAAEKIAREKVEKQAAEKARDIDSITGKKIIDKPVSLCFYKAKIDQTYVSYERPASNVVIEVTTKTYKDFEPVKIVVDSKRYNRAQFFSKFSGGYGCLVSLLLPVIGIMLTIGIYYYFSDALITLHNGNRRLLNNNRFEAEIR